MGDRALTSAERGWLDYLNDIGFADLYLGEENRSATREGRQAVTASVPAEVASAAPSQISTPKLEPGSVATAPALAALSKEAAACTACGLSQGRKSVVFGAGNPDADLMFIGEGPGAEEDRQGLPFVGPAGGMLTKIIEAIDMKREDVYIANVVKCRPPRNRDPEPDEVAACGGYLEKQIELVNPRVIVALGRVAAQTLLGLSSPLGRMRGSWHSVCGIPTRVTYHPAALLRNASYKRPTWDDLQIVRDRLLEAGC